MTLKAVTIKNGHAADFGSMGRPLSWYKDLAHNSDVTVVVIDMMTKDWTTDFHRALEAGLTVTLFQGYEPSAFAKPAEARLRARMMVSAVSAVSLAKNSDVFLDWESVPSSVSRQAAIQWIDTWLKEVNTSDARAGIYEGPSQPLTAQDFDTHFPQARRWKSLSTVPHLTTGYVMLQKHGNVNHHGYEVDWDVIQPDQKGRTLTVTQGTPAKASSPPASSSPTVVSSSSSSSTSSPATPSPAKSANTSTLQEILTTVKTIEGQLTQVIQAAKSL